MEMETSPSSEPEPEHVPRSYPCPRCESTQGFNRVGKFRSQCTNCNSTVPNSEIGRDNLDPQ